MAGNILGEIWVPGLYKKLGVSEDATKIIVGSTAIVPARTDAAQTFTGTQTFTGAVSIADGTVQTATNVGTVTTAATTAVIEYGNGVSHVTKLTMTNFAVGTGGDNASLGIGASFYTFPAGTIIVEEATMVGGLTLAADVTTGSPEVGIGTVIATGAVSVLSGTATFEDIIDGNASATGGDTTGTLAGATFYKNSDATTRDRVVIKTTGGKSHSLFLNVAVAWPDSTTGTLAVTFTGVILLKWTLAT